MRIILKSLEHCRCIYPYHVTTLCDGRFIGPLSIPNYIFGSSVEVNRRISYGWSCYDPSDHSKKYFIPDEFVAKLCN